MSFSLPVDFTQLCCRRDRYDAFRISAAAGDPAADDGCIACTETDIARRCVDAVGIGFSGFQRNFCTSTGQRHFRAVLISIKPAIFNICAAAHRQPAASHRSAVSIQYTVMDLNIAAETADPAAVGFPSPGITAIDRYPAGGIDFYTANSINTIGKCIKVLPGIGFPTSRCNITRMDAYLRCRPDTAASDIVSKVRPIFAGNGSAVCGHNSILDTDKSLPRIHSGTELLCRTTGSLQGSILLQPEAAAAHHTHGSASGAAGGCNIRAGNRQPSLCIDANGVLCRRGALYVQFAGAGNRQLPKHIYRRGRNIRMGSRNINGTFSGKQNVQISTAIQCRETILIFHTPGNKQTIHRKRRRIHIIAPAITAEADNFSIKNHRGISDRQHLVDCHVALAAIRNGGAIRFCRGFSGTAAAKQKQQAQNRKPQNILFHIQHPFIECSE